MIYAVDRYQDILKVKEKRETIPSFSGREDKYHYFDTEEEARAFLRQRADAACAKAEKSLALAIVRTKKCQRKFGESPQPPSSK